ncbi:Acetyltransferase, GNAT family [uncultured Eubacteriales bacterium]|uniref:Acetyltransferase, GNAT family n=1 Tax=uncultured Eubacteriales bacterium TaxID=172733 RepID=A0A212JXN8_9FIRM|nr:Acetyltransferase, GNAT family [uncultured Eubacteriales bacterium]
MYEIKFCTEEEVHPRIAGLREYNKRFIKETSDLSCYLEDETGHCAGGISAWRADELIYVDLLFVEESKRKLGLGAKLLSFVEEEGRKLGVKYVELNTFGFQAPGFYEKQGYHQFGKLENCVNGYGHYFYLKEL